MKSEIQRAQSIQYHGFAEQSAFIDKGKKRNQRFVDAIYHGFADVA